MRSMSLTTAGLALVAVIGVVVVGLALAVSPARGQDDITYNVTIENLTGGQPFTPPLVVAHSDQIDLFKLGLAATAELKELAENGNNDPLVALFGGSDAVFDMETGTGPILPGESAIITVEAPEGSLLSVAAMLICTNDGFTGVDSRPLPASGSDSIDVNSYDAGTELNTEDFAHIVPPCQALIGVTSDDEGTGMSDPTLVEGGFIAPHIGILGGTDLTMFDHGWTDPVARITVNVMPSPPPGGEPPVFSAARFTGTATIDGVPLPDNHPGIGAQVNGINCGSGLITGGTYTIDVASDLTGKEGCGKPGDTVVFVVLGEGDPGGQEFDQQGIWDNTKTTELNLTLTTEPGGLPPTGGPPGGADSASPLVYVLLALGGLAVLVGSAGLFRRLNR